MLSETPVFQDQLEFNILEPNSRRNSIKHSMGKCILFISQLKGQIFSDGNYL